MSSSSSNQSYHAPAEASSSRSPLSASPLPEGDSSADAWRDGEEDEEALLAEDPLNGDLQNGNGRWFKRKASAKPSFTSRFLPSPFTRSQNASPIPRPASARGRASPGRADPSTDAMLSGLNTSANGGIDLHDTKDASGLDWYLEGPGRRVGYDDLTAIDWIYEYAKERTRLRQLTATTSGLLGHAKLVADASQIWCILLATGVAVGGLAAGIDVASDWLGDLKTGLCSDITTGGKFYLNKGFCCWGLDSLDACQDWRPWSTVFGVANKGGGYIIEYLLFVTFSVLFAACASILVNRYALYAKQSGIPEIKTVLGGFVIRRFLGPWTLVVKSLGLCLAVASGMWLGKEGPLVHVACCCANLFMKLSPNINGNEARKRETLSAAAASGISVAFGSPIGGVLFSLEQLSYYFPDKTMWQSFVCAMIAAVTLQAFNPFRTGKLVLYQVTYHTGWHAFEIVPFAFIGIVGGLYGGLFIKLNMRINTWRQSQANPFLKRPILEVVVVAAVTALIGFPVTFLRAQSSELVYFLFAECADLADDPLGLCKSGVANTGVIFLLLFSAAVGFLLATVTFGLQIPAGILLPSMAIGALYGRVVGLIVELAQRNHPSSLLFAACEPDVQCVTPGTYAIIGAASALAGATRMTVSIVVIMFELTGALTYVLPIMVAVLISKWVGDAFGPRGIYESWIDFNGYPFLDNRDAGGRVPDVPAARVMTHVDDLVCIAATGHTIATLADLLRAHPFRGFPVIASPLEPVLLGYISRTELAFALDAALGAPRHMPLSAACHFVPPGPMDAADADVAVLDLRPWMDQTPLTLFAKARLQLATDLLQKLGLRYVVFVEGGVLEGLLTKKDVWSVLNEGAAGVGSGKGVLREEGRGEGRGLLGEEGEGGGVGRDGRVGDG